MEKRWERDRDCCHIIWSLFVLFRLGSRQVQHSPYISFHLNWFIFFCAFVRFWDISFFFAPSLSFPPLSVSCLLPFSVIIFFWCSPIHSWTGFSKFYWKNLHQKLPTVPWTVHLIFDIFFIHHFFSLILSCPFTIFGFIIFRKMYVRLC